METISNQTVSLENDENLLFDEISELIEHSRRTMYVQVNNSTISLFWQIGKCINNDILNNKRADYGKKIIPKLSILLMQKYGSSFALRNLRRMMQFAEQFSDFEIVSPLATQLRWSHFVEILPLKSLEAKLFYLNEANRGLINRKQLRQMINRKAYERKEIANTQLATESPIPIDTFKDPYLFDVLGLKDEYLEADLEEAILRELEKFILEFGKDLHL